MLSKVRSLSKKPFVFLSLVNILCTGISLAKNFLAIRILGPEQFGAVSIIIGVNTVAVNIIDVRLVDLISKLYYENKSEEEDEIIRYRTSVMQVGILIYLLLAFLLLGLSFLLNFIFVHFFTDTTIPNRWLLISALTQSLLYLSSVFTYLQRFTEKLFLMGILQSLTNLSDSIIFLGILFLNKSLDGYLIALLSTAFLGTIVAGSSSIYIWVKYNNFPILKSLNIEALADYRKHMRFIFMTNILGYVKVLHRASDILFVGFFCNDLQTGLYKVSRSLTDCLYILYDAANKTYQPTFLSLLSKSNFSRYRQIARKSVCIVGLFTIVTVILEFLFLKWLVDTILGSKFSGAESSIITLTLPFFFVTGMHLWIWPAYIYYGRLFRYTIYNLISVLAGQYFISAFIFWMTGSENIVWFSLGYLIYYIILYGCVYMDMLKSHVEIVPFSLKQSNLV